MTTIGNDVDKKIVNIKIGDRIMNIEKTATSDIYRDNIVFTCRSVNNDRDYTINGRVGSIGHLIMDIAFLLPDDEVFEWVGDDIRWSSDADGVVRTYNCEDYDDNGYDELDQLEDFLGKIDRCFDNTFNCDYRIGGYVVCASENDDEIDRYENARRGNRVCGDV